jgi:hypothetical protein
MKIDNYEFEQTARVLMVINPSCREKFQNWKSLMNFMISMAYQYCDKSASFGTAGFCLTAFDGFDGERIVRSSVQTYTVYSYIMDRCKSEMAYLEGEDQ